MIQADTAAGIETKRRAFLRKWRLKCRAVADSLEEAGDRLFTFTRRDPSQWKSALTTNAIERLNEEFRRRIKTQTVLPCAETVPMLPWALLASGQLQMRKVDGWETLSQPITPMSLDHAARETDTSHARRPPPGNFRGIRDTTDRSADSGLLRPARHYDAALRGNQEQQRRSAFMIKTVKQACRFNPIIRDYQMNRGIEKLLDLINDEGDGREFFSRNYVTHGMDQLFREGLLRLSGKSDQAVFELTQAMGGGKTHMMIALGLLARHPTLREDVLPADLVSRIDFGKARIAAFNGRNNPDNFIWGEIATQLGAAEAIKPFWANGPKAVDQRVWKEIIGDQPTLILLDELPPYLNYASTQVFGQGTLANMVVYSLSCLMSAALELPKCAIVIANLSGSYKVETKALADAISNLQQETRRQAMTITPVQLAGNEIYEILKKRLIDELPDERVISDTAEEYAQQVKKAEDGGYIVASSIEQIAEQVRETYPFHPSFKHLVALFKENEGFQQTRGLMQFTARLLKSVDERETDDVFLIGAQHLNLNDEQVKDEIGRIAPTLMPAVTHDIADKGNAIAEHIDAELDGDAAQQLMTLLLASSLSRAVGGRIGLSESELIEFLAAPQRKPDDFLQALQRLRESAWYLHREEQRFFIKETENLSRQIERIAKEVPQPKVDQALINRLTGILDPVRKIAYQDVQVLPKLDELKLGGPRTLIVIKPDGKVPPSELQQFFDYQQEKNNFLVLTGQDSHLADAVRHRTDFQPPQAR
jgi:hypothetical protein